MAGMVTVRVKLDDGTVAEYRRDWFGDNPAFEGACAEKAAFEAAEACRDAIEATHRKLPEQAVFTKHKGQR
ncbi:hypothetical protein [Pseudarthrobacter sp. PS3-L1]|uniref:hypothetical protein n=1 Tax=Pseudarthrobacter sp. PS3-L1 TaxID=3046207 RepID=UPI0024BAABA0|nr:hypothetical protein [Pseudarthrobacter sp. PS3-L1]MDJ0319782.1 hypothetical protein [Pseudarthrobacter sp. PS3-L1]